MKSYVAFVALLALVGGASAWYFFAPNDSSASGTVIVAGNTATAENEIGWMFNRDAETAATYAMVTGGGSTGIGSLLAGPISNTNFNNIANNDPNRDKFVAEYFPGNILVSDFNSFSYDVRIVSEAAQNQVYLNVYANIDASDNFYDCRYDYILSNPAVGSVTKHVVYAGIAPNNVQKRGTRIANCPPVLEQMPAGSTIRAFAINLGDTSASDTGLSANFDNVELIVNNDATYFDFEPLPQTKDACQKDNWKNYGFKNQGQCMKSL